MKLYCEGNNYKLYNGSMLEILEVIDVNSIDSIVTDPPYELNFMGKGWDNSGIAFLPDTWRKCYEVLKPGGYLLAFGGSRTFHRIACAIEDAGFEIRDTIMWLYGCLSEDTEVLTERGFKKFKDIKEGEKIRVYDVKNDIYKWETPERWSVYTLNEDTCYRIKSDYTDQLVSRNHRCLIERDGSLIFEYAENLDCMERVPVLSCDISFIQEGDWKLLQPDMLWQGKKLAKGIFSEWKRKAQREEGKTRREESSMEERCDISESEGELCNSKNKICQMPGSIYADGKEGRLCNGTSAVGGEANKSSINTERGCTSYKSQCGGQQNRKPDAVCNESRSQELREWKTYQTTLATVTTEQYSGIIYCPTVSTGCFVAKRNGKVFITGNSGFPKSMNIGKAVEAKLTTGSANTQEFKNLKGEKTESGDWGIDGNNNQYGARPADYSADKHLRTVNVDFQTEEGNRWKGWGTTLKPSYEPIIVARKPCEGSCVDNVLKYGVGGINIDECRIGFSVREPDKRVGTDAMMKTDKMWFDNAGGYEGKEVRLYNNTGRFPANMIFTYDDGDFEEVCGGFPVGKKNGSITKQYKKNNIVYGEYGDCDTWEAYNDSGSAARYFYCAKASKRDRDEGLENLEIRYRGMSNQAKAELSRDNVGFDGGSAKTIGLNRVIARKNIHPTVKPTDLMQYLVRLVTPDGGVVLDPFNGSGSTGKAVMYENKDRNKGYRYIGIEMNEEYLEISKARIDYVIGGVVKEPEEEIKEGQISIFDLLEE